MSVTRLRRQRRPYAIARAHAPVVQDARGAVMVEFVLAFVPVFCLFLGILQLAQVAAASLVVRRAASAGVRSASVVLDDDPRFYEGTPRNVVRGARQARRQDGDLSALGEQIGFGSPAAGSAEPDDSPRMAAIRKAVHRPLTAIAPAPGAVFSAASALGDDPLRRWFLAPAAIAASTTLSFPVAPGSREVFEERVELDGQVTLRVTHDYACQIPLGSALVCTAGVARLEAEASAPVTVAPYAYASEAGQAP